MKLLMENWRQFLKESEVPYEKIQTIIDNNQYLRGKIKATSETIHDLGDKYLLMSGVSHIAERHRDPCFPGSLFSAEVDESQVEKAILNIVGKMNPQAGKALAVPSGIPNLGMERLVKATPEEISDFEDYVMQGRTPVKVKIKREGQNPGQVTDRLTVIAPPIGEVEVTRRDSEDGVKVKMPVLSLVTALPGS